MRTAKRLGIVGCMLMEDEMVYALAKDDDIGEIVFVDNEERLSLYDKLGIIMPQVKMRIIKDEELGNLPPPESFSLLIWMKDMGLHESPEKLKNDMTETLGRMRGVCDLTLLFYGLCGNAFKDVDELSRAAGNPVVILTDALGETVDDCIAAVVGGREQYRELVTKNLGVYFMTPMWAKHWREMAVKTRVVPDGNNNELMKIVFEASGYKKVFKIETETGDGDYEKRVTEFAGIFGLAKETLRCDLRVIDITYGKAKECLSSIPEHVHFGTAAMEVQSNAGKLDLQTYNWGNVFPANRDR